VKSTRELADESERWRFMPMLSVRSALVRSSVATSVGSSPFIATSCLLAPCDSSVRTQPTAPRRAA